MFNAHLLNIKNKGSMDLINSYMPNSKVHLITRVHGIVRFRVFHVEKFVGEAFKNDIARSVIQNFGGVAFCTILISVLRD